MRKKTRQQAGIVSIPTLAVITGTLCAVALILAFTFLFRTNSEIVNGKNSTESISFSKEKETQDSQGVQNNPENNEKTNQQTAEDSAADSAARLLRPAPADAQEGTEFRAPSGNIACKFSAGVSCTIYEYAFKAPENCTDSPITFTVNSDGTNANCANRVGSNVDLAYGNSMKNNGYACSVSENGVDCWSEKTGDGFTIARETASYTQN
ncbi:hypothetical protein RQN30_08460 [Arcanobacterium hippocoleae]